MLEAYAVVAASNKPTTVYAEYLFVCVRDGAIYPSTCLSVHLDRQRQETETETDRQTRLHVASMLILGELLVVEACSVEAIRGYPSRIGYSASAA